MPTLITKRGVRRWRGHVEVNGVKRQKVFADESQKSKRAAIVWEDNTRKELKAFQSQIHTACCQTLDWANDYLTDTKERFVAKTFQEKRLAFKRLLHYVTPESLVEDLTPAVASRFLTEQFNGRSGYAANKDRKNLATAWKWGASFIEAFPKGLPNPFLAVRKFPEIRKPRYVPPKEDFYKVLGLAEGQDKVMLLAQLHLAARKGEVFRIKMSDLDFATDTICLWTRKRKEGSYESNRLPMTTELRQALFNWRSERLSHNTIDTEHLFVCLDPYPFCEPYFGKPFTSRQHLMRRLCKRAGVKPFGFHAIRHLSASILYHKGYEVSLIQQLLRHKSPTTTERYLKGLGDKEVRKGLEAAFGRKAEVIAFPEKKIPDCNRAVGENLCPDSVSGYSQ